MMWRKRFTTVSLIVSLSLILTAFISSGLPVAKAQTNDPSLQQPMGKLTDASLEQVSDKSKKEKCEANNLKWLEKSKECTHGPDSAPAGVDISRSVEPVATQSTSLAQCDGDGVTGYRTQVIYARASDRADRYSTYLASFRQWAHEADKIYQNSAAETGSSRAIRFVHDANCNIVVDKVVLSTTGDDTFDNTITELKAKGYSRTDRKYMIFMDADIIKCGQGNLWGGDDRPDSSNSNNIGPSYGRTDLCGWGSGVTPAHEHMHNLGGVLISAPNSNHPHGGGPHCHDEYDIMCRKDGPGVTIRYDCPDTAGELLFDCNHNDYFHTNPPADSYLATHWNTANSRFLIKPKTPPPWFKAP